jgi:hypothetical protein
MKNMLSPHLLVFLLFFALASETLAQSAKGKTGNNPKALNGAWQRVYSYNGKATTSGEPKEFALVHDGFFSSIGQDSTGRWKNTHGGIYEISGNIMKTKLLYASSINQMGSINWVEYEVKGDTLIMNWFKKVIDASGKDITARMPKAKSKFIRMKNPGVDAQ